jgi:hypothetical protein
MIISLFNRLTATTDRIAAGLVAAWIAIVASGTPTLAPVRARRGAGFLEWALLAALALGIAAILWRVFPSAFEGLLNRIRDGINRR